MSIKTKNNKLSLFSEFLNELFEKMDDCTIDYAVLRNYEGFPEISYDLDLLVADFGSFLKAACAAADGAGWKLAKKIQKSSSLNLYFVNLYSDSILAAHLDSVSPLTWVGLEIVNLEVLKGRRLYRNSFYILQPGSEAAMTLIKSLLFDKKIKEKYKARLPDLVRSDRLSFCKALEPCFGLKLTEILANLTCQGDWDRIETLTSNLRFGAALRALRRDPVAQFGRWIAALLGYLMKLFRPSGLFVVFMGPDGSGKSTLAGSLRHHLKPLFPISRYFHGHFAILPRLRNLGRACGTQTPRGVS